MPCDTIRRTPVTFENLVFKPGHIDLMVEALGTLGFEVVKSTLEGGVVQLRIFPRGQYQNQRNTITYERGSLQVPSPMQGRFSLEKLQNAYGMAAAKLTAKKNGWQFHQTSETEFEFLRR